MFSLFRSLLLCGLVVHLAVLVVLGGDGEILHLGVLVLDVLLLLVRPGRQGAPGDPDLVTLVQRRRHRRVVLVRDVLLLPSLVPTEHDGGVEEAAGTAGAGLQSEGALVEGGARPDGGGALYGAEISESFYTGGQLTGAGRDHQII